MPARSLSSICIAVALVVSALAAPSAVAGPLEKVIDTADSAVQQATAGVQQVTTDVPSLPDTSSQVSVPQLPPPPAVPPPPVKVTPPVTPPSVTLPPVKAPSPPPQLEAPPVRTPGAPSSSPSSGTAGGAGGSGARVPSSDDAIAAGLGRRGSPSSGAAGSGPGRAGGSEGSAPAGAGRKAPGGRGLAHTGFGDDSFEAATIAPWGRLLAYVWPAIVVAPAERLLLALQARWEAAIESPLADPLASPAVAQWGSEGGSGVAGLSERSETASAPPELSPGFDLSDGDDIVLFLIACAALTAVFLFSFRHELRRSTFRWPL